MDIRTIIPPFKSVLPTPASINMQGLPADSLRNISMVSSATYVYDDGVSAIKVPIWGYDGTYPGPTIEVTSGTSIQVEWHNRISAQETLPIAAEIVDFAQSIPRPTSVPQNLLGVSGGVKTPEVIAKANLVPHMHGGKTAPNYDGWPEGMIMSRQHRRFRYDNDERAAMHWYHDHAMHTTRLNAYAGLAGLYVIRDSEEAALKLPTGHDEIFMVVQDRNLESEKKLAKGVNKNRLLHKVESLDGPLEFFGPLNLVNGMIWPMKEVDAGLYRLRILNGANARTYAFQFIVADKNAVPGKTPTPASKLTIFQIGTDGGLLPKAKQHDPKVPFVMMPAERVDLLVDFSAYAKTPIMLVNAATAPFGGDESIRPLDGNFFPTPMDYDTANPAPAAEAERNPYPEVMLFNVGVPQPNHPGLSNLKGIINAMPAVVKSFDKAKPDPAKVTRTRTIMLVEKPMMAGEPAMLTHWELIPEAEITGMMAPFNPILRTLQRVEIDGEGFYVGAERFQDPLNYQVIHGTTEKWRFINVSPDAHPMHLHLVQFLHTNTVDLNSIETVDVNGILGPANANVATDFRDPTLPAPEEIVAAADDGRAPLFIKLGNVTSMQPEDVGLKDTIRVDKGKMVEIVARFEGYLGRYLYHCHILEHEDHDMMRQFVVTRPDLPHHSMHHPVSSGK